MKNSVVFWGVGNSIMGDDGAGPWLALELEKLCLPWLTVYNCETVPENYIAPLRKAAPETLLVADAAQMGLAAGEFRKMSICEFSNITFTTHGMPLDLLLNDLMEKIEIVAIGIQPLERYPGEYLSTPVKQSLKKICSIIERKDWNRITAFHQEKRSPR